jgi:hypothetical protein
VAPHHPKYASIDNCPIVPAVTACTDPETGATFILVINQGIYVGEEMKMTLINPNQLWAHGIIVDDYPRHLSPNPSTTSHSIFVPEHDLRIPLKLRGVHSCFSTRYPTLIELETYPWIELTSSNEWSPHDGNFEDAEDQLIRDHETTQVPLDRNICSMETSEPILSSPLCDLYHAACNKVRKSSVSTTVQRSTQSRRDKVSQTFGAGLDTAEQTIKATTQLALQNVTQPKLKWRNFIILDSSWEVSH